MGPLVVVLSLLIPLVAAAPRVSRGPAYDYIYRDDPNYRWEKTGQLQQDGFTTYFINMTSQQWLSEEYLDRSIWWHNLIIHVPDQEDYPGSGALFISGRSNTNGGPDMGREHVKRMGEFAVSKKMVTAVLEMVPNQPIKFADGEDGEREDGIIAYTWRKFLDESIEGRAPPPELPLHIAMTKSAVRGMDTMSAFVQEQLDMMELERFLVAGESKRGWTTWLTGAVDDRVVAMAPTVLSCINMKENFHHYYRSFGGWPFVMIDYWRYGLMAFLDIPEMEDLQKVTDPYAYKEWMTMPKLIVSGASDEFFMLDDFEYFYNDLPGEKHIWILENHGHSIKNGPLSNDYWKSLATFYTSVLKGQERPTYEFWRNNTATGGSITVRLTEPPKAITSFSAPSVVPYRRDFRLKQLGLEGVEDTGIVWLPAPVEDLGNNLHKVEFDNPSEGYLAFFIKITFDASGGEEFIFTTEAQILPEGFPYDRCQGEDCLGFLV